MVIDELSEQECQAVLQRGGIGHLGCCKDGQPYVVQVLFAYQGGYMYVLSTVGQKIEWLRENPKTCMTVDEIASETDWTSVIANGVYEELVKPRFNDEREHAKQLLEKRHHWWQTAFAERQTKTDEQLIEPILFRIHVGSVSGLRAHS